MNKLYKIAEDNNVDIDYIPLRELKAVSIPGSVALDPKKIKTQQEEREVLAHELGHQMRYAFYTFTDSDITKARKEERADRWAVMQLIPPDELRKAFSAGMVMIYQLAEYFDVSYDFMHTAIRIYRAKGEIDPS